MKRLALALLTLGTLRRCEGRDLAVTTEPPLGLSHIPRA
jgi:hypothetical protein